MRTRSSDFELTTDERRATAGFALACAEPALVIVRRERPDDPRPAAALDAARAFAEGAPRSRLQRTAAADAHRAARDAPTPAAGHAATAAGDAAPRTVLPRDQGRPASGRPAHAGLYRTTEPLRVVEEVTGWERPPPAMIQGIRERMAELAELGIEALDD